MRAFYVKITKSDAGKNMYNVEFWHYKDLRYNKIVSEIPMNEILDWVGRDYVGN